jgi:hypothetical protein
VLVIAIEAEHKKPNGRRQVCALPIFVNAGDKLPQGLAPILRDLSQAFPKRVFQADAGLVARDDN